MTQRENGRGRESTSVHLKMRLKCLESLEMTGIFFKKKNNKKLPIKNKFSFLFSFAGDQSDVKVIFIQSSKNKQRKLEHLQHLQQQCPQTYFTQTAQLPLCMHLIFTRSRSLKKKPKITADNT